MAVLYILCVIVVILLLNSLSSSLSAGRDSTITFIAGQIGSGKSAYSVRCARRALRSGRPVYSTDYIEGCRHFDVTWLHDMKCPEGALLIIDEAALKFNSREFAKISKDLIAYFKKARHYKNDVILISQTFSDTDKQIREVANRVLFMRKVGWITLPLRVSGDIAIGEDGQPCMRYKIGRFAKPFVPARWGKYYDSFEDGENRKVCPCEPWDSEPAPAPVKVGLRDKMKVMWLLVRSKIKKSPSPDVERNDACNDLETGFETGSETTNETEEACTTPQLPEFTENDAKELIAGFSSGKGIDLSKFFKV